MKYAMFVLLALAARAAATPVTHPGEVLFATRFDTRAEREAWTKAGFADWTTGHEGTQSLRVTVPPARAGGGNMIRLPLDLTRFRGCLLAFECLAKAENVTRPAASYLGVKFMLHYQSPATGPVWQNENDVFGSFEWRKLAFTTRIAPDATAGELNLGLQGSSGTAWFDEVRVTVLKIPVHRPAPMANPPPLFKGHSLPRLRGVMSPDEFSEADLRTLGAEWGANLIRWQITRNWGKVGTDRDPAEYDRWLDAEIGGLDRALDACRRHGMLAVIDMHSPPGGRYSNKDLAIFHELPYQDHWIANWEKIARRYRGNPAVWAYDLVNEPVQNSPSPAGVADYLGAQVRAARAIRAIDPDTPIMIEAAEWDSAAGFRDLEPVDIPRVIYQVHMYAPGSFTHQGVHSKSAPITYPGLIEGVEWNKERIRATLQPVREFQLAYNVHIYAGEFSAIRWAPGAAAYIRDCIGIFEEYGWDWSYHAYREWDGWSVEHDANPDNHQPATAITDRKQVLLDWFRKNQRP
jgi:endoglucanase